MCMHAKPPKEHRIEDAKPLGQAATAKLSAAQRRAERSITSVLVHAGELVSPRAVDAVMDEMIDFIWKYGKGKDRYCVCSICKASFPIPDGIKRLHYKPTTCPICGKTAMAVDAWRGRKWAVQEFYLAEWRKSTIDPNVIVMVGSYCRRDCSGPNPEAAQTIILPIGLYAYRYGEYAVCFKREFQYIPWQNMLDEPYSYWEPRKKCTSAKGVYMGYNIQRVLNVREWHREAIARTPFEKTWSLLTPDVGRYVCADYAADMEAIAKHPYLEYMAKMGQVALARQGLDGYPRGIINHRGRTAQEVLNMTGRDLRDVKALKIKLDVRMLLLKQTLNHNGIDWPMARIAEINAHSNQIDFYWMNEALGRFPASLTEKAAKYLFMVYADSTRWQDRSDLRDYWSQLTQLGIDFGEEQVSLPKNLAEMHQRMTDRINLMKAEEQARKINAEMAGRQKELAAFQKRLPELERMYGFEFDGLVLRPMRSVDEVIQEGNALAHCVANYATSYISGNIVLCALRRAEAPDEPFRTVEFSAKGELRQCRGIKNDRGGIPVDVKKSVDAFFEAFRRRETRRKSA